jgi:hypothetical protein
VRYNHRMSTRGDHGPGWRAVATAAIVALCLVLEPHSLSASHEVSLRSIRVLTLDQQLVSESDSTVAQEISVLPLQLMKPRLSPVALRTPLTAPALLRSLNHYALMPATNAEGRPVVVWWNHRRHAFQILDSPPPPTSVSRQTLAVESGNALVPTLSCESRYTFTTTGYPRGLDMTTRSPPAFAAELPAHFGILGTQP